jgi:hypothetical protein
MGFQSEFAEILQKKMGEDTHTPPHIETPPPIKRYFFQETVLNFKFKKTWKPIGAAEKYPSINVVKTKVETPLKRVLTGEINEIVNEITYSIDSLKDEKKLALQDFIKVGARLNLQELSDSSIKKEYRRLLKIYHPDYCKLKDASLILERIIKLYKSLSQ